MTTSPDALVLASPDRDRLRQIGRKVRRRLAANKAVRRIQIEQAELWATGRFLDAVECGRLISIIDAVARPSVALGHDYSSGFRTSSSGDVDPSDPFIAGLQARFDALLGLDPRSAEPIQGQRYTVGQEFKPHVDWFHPQTAIWDREQHRGGQRAITAMVFLNSVEGGGATDFPGLGIAVEPHPGTLLMWNNTDESGLPNRWTLHAGMPVTHGVKYVITRWYRSGRWA